MDTVKLGYNELGYNVHSVITDEYFSPKCTFTTQIDQGSISQTFFARVFRKT